MICFEISLNGEKLCRAGIEDMLVMTSIVNYLSRRDDGMQEMALDVGGLYDNESNEHVHPIWIDRKELRAGDEVTIRIIEAVSADKPIHEKLDAADFVEEQQRKYYEHLKAKFQL